MEKFYVNYRPAEGKDFITKEDYESDIKAVYDVLPEECQVDWYFEGIPMDQSTYRAGHPERSQVISMTIITAEKLTDEEIQSLKEIGEQLADKKIATAEYPELEESN